MRRFYPHWITSLASVPPLSLTVEDMDSLDEIVKRGRPLKKGEFLFRQGDPFRLGLPCAPAP